MMLLKAIFALDFLTIYAYIYICIYVKCMIVRYLVNLLQLEKIISLLIFRKVFLSLFHRFCGKRLYISTRQCTDEWDLNWFDLGLGFFLFLKNYFRILSYGSYMFPILETVICV